MKFKEGGGGGAGGKDFLKLPAGGVAKGVFRGDVHEFKQHWPKEADRPTVCPEDASCEFCKEGKVKAGFRFRLNFLINENGAYVAKIFEQGWMVYCQLRDMHSSDYNLEKTIVKITRNGDGKNTTYTIMPLPGEQGAVSAQLEAKLKAVPLIPLTEAAAEEDHEDDSASDDGVPF